MTEETFQEQPDLLTVASKEEAPCYFLRLTLENVRSFGSPQTLDLSDGRGRPNQWTILLGDNGSGKTTLLQSLAAIVPREMRVTPGRKGEAEDKPYVPEIFVSNALEEKGSSGIFRCFLVGVFKSF